MVNFRSWNPAEIQTWPSRCQECVVWGQGAIILVAYVLMFVAWLKNQGEPWNYWGQCLGMERYGGVLSHGGTRKSSTSIGFSIINQLFWGSHVYGNSNIVEIFWNRCLLLTDSVLLRRTFSWEGTNLCFSRAWWEFLIWYACRASRSNLLSYLSCCGHCQLNKLWEYVQKAICWKNMFRWWFPKMGVPLNHPIL